MLEIRPQTHNESDDFCQDVVKTFSVYLHEHGLGSEAKSWKQSSTLTELFSETRHFRQPGR